MIRVARMFAVTLLTAALASCSDAPLAPARENADPDAAAANHILGSAARVHQIESNSSGTRLRGLLASRSGSGPSQVGSSMNIPIYCNDPSDSPYCPQIYVGAAVYDGGTNPDGSRKAVLYAHNDVDNVSESTLYVYYGVGGGCSGSTSTFASDYLSGGAGGPYALVGQKVVTFSGGPATYSVNAIGQAKGPYGSIGEDSAYASRCV